MEVAVILVGPQHPGNVGAASRVAANFGVTSLKVVAPECDWRGNEAQTRAVHAKGLLASATEHATLAEALAAGDISMAVGTTARTSLADNRFQRKPLDVRDFVTSLGGWDGRLAWVFGREDSGLTKDEVDRLDQLVTIPTSEYWSLNLSHAVGICCYETFRPGAASLTPPRTLTPGALEAMNRAWDDLVDETETREWRKQTAQGVWRKMIGRSAPDTYEVHNIMGILANTLKRFGRAGYETPNSRQVLGERGLLVARDAGEDEGLPSSRTGKPGSPP